MTPLERLDVIFSTPDHPSGVVALIFTKQLWKLPDGTLPATIPVKECARCHVAYPLPIYLKYGTVRGDGLYWVTDTDMCPICVPRKPIAIHARDGKLRMRVEMHDALGRMLQWFDESAGSRRWKTCESLALRRMTRGGNQLRLQPRTQRDRDLKGVKYE